MERPPRPIRLIALDVDGTLLDPEETIRPRVRAAVQAARDAGVLVTLATGRRFVGASEIAADLGLSLPLILHGGAVIQESGSGAVIYQDPIEPDTVAGLVALSVEHGCQVIAYESPALASHPFAGPRERDNEAVRRYESLRGPFGRVAYEEMHELRQVLSLAALGEADSLLRLSSAISRRGDAAQVLARWALTDCDVLELFRAGCSKASALAHLAEAHGIELDEVMAIGDGVNDCEILGAVGFGVAMGNACAEACASACIQVGTNEQDGVAEAIERWVLA